MSVIHAPKKPELDMRMLAFPGVMLAAMLVLFARLWFLQVVKAQELVERAEASRTVTVTQPAPRGLIYDRNGRLIAGVRPEFVITAMPSLVKKHPDVVGQVAKILGVDSQKLWTKVHDERGHPDLFSPIYAGARMNAGIQIAETRDDLPGIGVELAPMRYYPDSTSFTHVLGYVWSPNGDDVERIEKLHRKPADYVGKAGVERAFEADLMGDPGTEEREIDAKRRSVRLLGGNAARPGNQLVLSLDSTLQKFATKYMADGKYVGGVVALDPKTGEILCLVSSPTFDQNLFTGGISDSDWNALTEDEEKPMLDRAIRSAYAPGSTFKIVTSIAAYESGKFDPDMHFECDGGVHVGKAYFKCLGHHGWIGYYDALEKSCNSFFYQLGRLVGEDALRKASLDVGLGQRQGLEIGGESKGIVPTRELMPKLRKGGRWYAGDTLNFAIGQGFVSATPLQLANMVALVANNGTNYKPHLVREIRSAEGKGPVQYIQPQVFKHIDASPEFWADLKHGLVGVIDKGTAQVAKIPGVEWGGKTGSAEHGRDKSARTQALFVGFAPAEDPKIAICVLIEGKGGPGGFVEGVGHGGEFAAPPAKDIVEAYLAEGKTRGLAKSAASASAATALAVSPKSR